jgi:ERCC4-type nuclease
LPNWHENLMVEAHLRWQARGVMLIVTDVHERGSGVPALLGDRGATVEVRSLSAGDYRLAGGAVVERKTVRGMHMGIVAGTFWPQIGRLRRGARFAYLLIEGCDLDDGPLAPAAVRGACLAVADLGVTVLQSVDPCDSALWLHRLAARRQHAPPRHRPAYAQRPKAEAAPQAAEAMLASVPGISTVSARALLTRFGSVAAVVAAEPTDWEAVAGIGPQRALSLAETLRSPYAA